ncbi:ribosomal protein S11 [Carex littledalei]|uniref:Ribosomal protein S11 n=1 Tax=Carex littledalei TaxID=544730 RepID=A0A833RAX6_9POAL|nr:ribosomal protein S11 [Carex littledalei]
MASLLTKKLSPLLRSSSHHSSLLPPLLRILSSQCNHLAPPFGVSSYQALRYSTSSDLPPINPSAPPTTESAPPATASAPDGFGIARGNSTFNVPPDPDRFGLGLGSFTSNMDFVRDRLAEDDELRSRRKKHDFVHFLLTRKKTFVTVTDVAGNRKTGASAGCLGSQDKKGRGRSSRYAAEATAEHVGRAAKKMGIKSVVMKVKGSVFFGKKKRVIMSWRDGYRGEGIRERTPIVAIHDVTQLPHNGCRLPKKRRI